MPVLSIDSSSGFSNILLADENMQVIGESVSGFHENHSVLIFKQLDDLLSSNSLRLKDIRSVAVSLGPGSFTGVRVSLVIAKTLSYVLGLNIAGVENLSVFAYSRANEINENNYLISLKEAGRGEYYFSSFEKVNGELKKLSNTKRLAPKDIMDFIGTLNGGHTSVICGHVDGEDLDRIMADFNGVTEIIPFNLRKLPYFTAKYLLENKIKTNIEQLMGLSPVYVYSEGPF